MTEYDIWTPDSELITTFQNEITPEIISLVNDRKHILLQEETFVVFDDKNTSKRTSFKDCKLNQNSIEETMGFLEAGVIQNIYDEAVTTWIIASPHRDIDLSDADATGYNGDRYSAFFFLQAHNHILQSGFDGNPSTWTGMPPEHETLITSGDIAILDLHNTHALGFKDGKHLIPEGLSHEQFVSHVKTMLDRKLSALIMDFPHFPSREEVMETLEAKMNNMLSLKNNQIFVSSRM